MKNQKSFKCSVILTAVLLLSTYARDKTAPAQQAVLSPPAPPGLKVSIEPKVIERGSPCLFTVTFAEAHSALSGEFMGKKVFFNPDQSRKTWYGLAGVGLESPLGKQTITLKGSDASGRARTFSVKFLVFARDDKHHEFTDPEVEEEASIAREALLKREVPKTLSVGARKTSIRVPPEFTDSDDEEKARIAREAILKREGFNKITADALWNGPFLRPVDANIRLTAVFAGTRRFNSGPVKTNRGVDFGAPLGTPIKAINSGRVILARNLFYDGNMVTIDHGQGLLSLYLYLSKMNVKEGDTVSSGQTIGLSGSTGRASGPHLHLQVKWGGTDIDPEELRALKLPSNLAKSN